MVHGCAHPMGPLALADLIGLDTTMAVAESMYADARVHRRSMVRWMPRSTASMSAGRSSAAGMMRCTEPTSSARSTLWMASNSAPTSPSFSRRTGVGELGQLGAQRRPARRLGRGGDARPPARAPAGRLRCARVDLAGEHDRRRGRAADHRGEGALDGEDLHVVVERGREHHEGAAVVAGHDAQHDRAVEVDDGPADLGAVLELQLAQRLRRAVEARQVGEDHDRAGCRWRR